MDEELKKQKYKILLNNINIIKKEMNEINIDMDNFKKYLKDNFTINNKIVEEERLHNIKYKINETYNDLVYDLIPNIRNKTY